MTAKIKSVFHLQKIIKSHSGSPSIVILLFFIAFYYFTNAADFKVGDEFAIRSMAKSFVNTGKLELQISEENLSIAEECCIKNPRGLYYIKWGVGQALVQAPFYVLYNFAQFLFNPEKNERDSYLYEILILHLCPSIVSAIGCYLVFLMGITFGFSKRMSVFICLLYGIATIAWPYSKSLMSDTTLNVAILGGVYGAISYNKSGRSFFLFVSAFCMGFALLTKITSAVIVPIICLYLFLSAQTRRSFSKIIFIFMPLILIFLGAEFMYNLMRYDNIFKFGYGYGRDGLFGFNTPISFGLWGLLLSPGKSIFLYSPIAILSLFAARPFYRAHRKEALLFLTVCVVFLLLHARWWAWSGDWAWGPRFLLIITPYLLIPVGYFFNRWDQFSLWVKKMICILIAASIFVQVLGISIHPFTFILIRTTVIRELASPEHQEKSQYAWVHNENLFANYSPLFSHVNGNWWLFKHMLFNYDIWSDAPWKSLGVNINLPPRTWIDDNRVIPFWWPYVLAKIYPTHRVFILFLASLNFILIMLFGFWLTHVARKEILSERGLMKDSNQEP